ncbi:hypothetical protein ACQEVF_24250 [Nonomuraea polychroma]|uniref:hypothetical protein n=1 Tax=Nonomuraea polychroma TaxID=46176 RepID=UPI003D90D75E
MVVVAGRIPPDAAWRADPAERLDLPSTTYRRYLTARIERICADLWHRELHGSRTTAYGQEPARK